MNKHLKKIIKSKQKAHQEEKSDIVEVRKCRNTVRIATSQVALVLAKDIKTNNERFF